MSIEMIDAENWDLLKRMIKKLLGFDPSSYTNSFMQRRVLVRLHALKIATYKEYISILKDSRHEQELLLKELTIHVTNFFRDQSMWIELKDKVIPLILGEKHSSGANSINLWSAGCSSGEEPLSLAICFLEALGEDLKGFKLMILATDCDAETIRRAKLAEYDEMQFKEMPKGYMEKYFSKKDVDVKIGSNTLSTVVYTPKPFLKSMITYEQDDILSRKKFRNLDLIMCRNTVIYFDIETKTRLYDTFYDCLVHNGFLILGKTEILQGPIRDRFQMYDLHERIHVKF